MNSKSTRDALQQRVAALEAELGETRRQLSLARSKNRDVPEDILRDLTRQLGQLQAKVRQLQDNEQSYRSIADHSQDFIMRINRELKPLYANENTKKILGLSAKEVIGRHPGEFGFPSDLIELWQETVQKVFDTGIINRIAYQLPDTTWIDCICIPEKDDSGEVVTVLTTGRDVTEWMKAKVELAASEERYRNILETIEEGYFELDLSGNLTFVNNAMCKITETPREELIGLNYREYVSAETAARMYRIFSRVYRTGEPARMIDYEIFDRRNRTKLFELSTSLLKDPQGNPVGFRGVVRDNTFKRQIEEERRELEKQLQQALRLEAVGTLAGGIAHDFNNLLTSILGNVSIMKVKTGPSHPHFEKLNRLEELVQSGADLTKQLLGFAMGGKYDVKPVVLNTIIDKNIRMIHRTRKDIVIEKEYGTDLWPVEADQGQIDQVLLNLYVNATHAMPDGGVLTFRTNNVVFDTDEAARLDLSPGKYVRVDVSDTGVGMDEITRDRVFEPFFTTKKMGHGTGLGLASAYGIIKNHKGKITVSSVEGEGTTFTIYLPVSEKAAVTVATVEGPVYEGRGTILLIDDEEAIREVGEEILKEIGYDVILAENGQRGVQLFLDHRDRIDLIILDLIMPETSGIETFKQLRQVSADVNILLASGYSITEQIREMLKDSRCRFIAKPFNLRLLSRRIKEMLSNDPFLVANA